MKAKQHDTASKIIFVVKFIRQTEATMAFHRRHSIPFVKFFGCLFRQGDRCAISQKIMNDVGHHRKVKYVQ